jgi:hypothetical protein
MRSLREDDWLMSFDNLVKMTFEEYRIAIYYHGNITTIDKEDIRVLLSDEVVQREKERGYQTSGIYRKRLRFFVDGMALGTEEFIRQQIVHVKGRGEYICRVNPIKQLKGLHLTLREQRSHAVEF